MSSKLKQSRWVKVHEPGQANFSENENVMDILLGAGRCQAEVTFTVRSYKKAAYWLNEYLKAAEALQTIADGIIQAIQNAAESANREDAEVTASGEGWNCEIEKMGDGSFKVQLMWATDEPLVEAKEKPAPKKRGRKPKNPVPETTEVTEEEN